MCWFVLADSSDLLYGLFGVCATVKNHLRRCVGTHRFPKGYNVNWCVNATLGSRIPKCDKMWGHVPFVSLRLRYFTLVTISTCIHIYLLFSHPDGGTCVEALLPVIESSQPAPQNTVPSINVPFSSPDYPGYKTPSCINTRTGQLPFGEVITIIPRPYHNKCNCPRISNIPQNVSVAFLTSLTFWREGAL